MGLDDIMELDYAALGLSIGLSFVFIIMIWKVPLWDTYPFRSKLIISIVLPIVSYFLVKIQINR